MKAVDDTNELNSVQFIQINFFIWTGQETFFSCLLIGLPLISATNYAQKLGHHFASIEFIQVRGLLPESPELFWSMCSFIFTSKLAFPHSAERPPGICPLCFAVTRHSPRVRGTALPGTEDAARFQLRLIIALWLFSEITGESHEEPCSLMQRVGLPIFHQNRAILPAVSRESSALLGAREQGGWETFPRQKSRG